MFFSIRPPRTYLWALILCALAVGSGIGLKILRPSYEALESQLIRLQHSAPDQALDLANTLMDDFPRQCLPFEIAANIHSLKKAYGPAEDTLLAAISSCAAPPALYVRLAHLYQRVRPEKLDPWISQMLRRPDLQRSPMLVAQLLQIGGNESQAIQHLAAAVDKGAGSVEMVVMLSRLHRRQRQPDKAGQVLVQAIDRNSFDQAEKGRLLAEVLSQKRPLDRFQVEACLHLMLRMAMQEEGYVASRKDLSTNLLKLIQIDSGKYAATVLRQRITRPTDHDLWVWLSSLYLEKIESPRAAFTLLRDIGSEDDRLLEERARLSVHSQDANLIRGCWQDLLKCRPTDIRIRLAYARVLNQIGDHPESHRMAARLVVTTIPDTLHWNYFTLCCDNAAALEDYDALVDIWIEAGARLSYTEFLTCKDLIFSRLPETHQHRRLLTVLNRKQETGPGGHGALDLLKVFTAEQLRDRVLYFAAADAFLTQRSTCSAKTIHGFVVAAIRAARPASQLLAKPNDRRHLPPQIAHFAAKWSTHLAEQYPGNPVYQFDKIVGRHLTKDHAKPEEACWKLLQGRENNHYHVQLAAQALYRLGRFEKAAHYYGRAIDLRPDIYRYRFGYAACMNQLHRYARSQRIYTELLTRPGGGDWDMQVVLQHLWVCFEQLKKTDRFVDFIDLLTTHPNLVGSKLRVSAATLLQANGRSEAAKMMLKKFIVTTPSPQHRYEAQLKLAQWSALQGNYEEAIRIYNDCLQRYDDRLKVIDCRYNRAEVQRRKGDFHTAMEQWQKLARQYPNDRTAAEALLAAASVAHNALQDLPQARTLYQAYLDLPPALRPMTEQVKAKLATIGGPH